MHQCPNRFFLLFMGYILSVRAILCGMEFQLRDISFRANIETLQMALCICIEKINSLQTSQPHRAFYLLSFNKVNE